MRDKESRKKSYFFLVAPLSLVATFFYGIFFRALIEVLFCGPAFTPSPLSGWATKNKIFLRLP